MDGKGKYSDEETVSFRWKTDDNEPEKIPQYMGDIFMDKDISGQYYYNKSNIIIISKDIDCIPDRVRNSPTNTGTFTDTRDSHVYKWVRVGKQIWMAENLNYVTDNSHCYGDNVTTSVCNQYGQLYKWEDAQKACPSGWHLPSEAEIDNLLNDVGGAGKAAYKQLILDGNSAFDALPGGYGTGNGTDNEFHFTPPGIGDFYTAFWSSSVGTVEACKYSDPNNNISSSRYSLGFDRSFSAGKYAFCSISDWLYVRCVKDKAQDNSLQTKIIESQKNIQVQANNAVIVKTPDVKQQTDTQINTNTQVKVDNGNNVKKPDVKETTNTSDVVPAHRFYIIVESYPSEESAKEEASLLKNKGYPNARVVGLSSSGDTWRISCSDFATKAEATTELPKIKLAFRSAWVFEKK